MTETAQQRFVCDSAMDFLLMETVSLMQEGFDSIEEERDAAYLRMEQLGHRVGMGLAERATRDRPRFADNLEIVKFICKDFWLLLFNKQIDNLKTNHRGVYVLTDSSFKWFSRMSADVAAETPQLALVHSAFPCGLIRGALSSLGLSSSVVAEVAAVPQCTFQIKFR
ncbi:Trafficking protein particle complex subunit 33 [Chytriomyces hyalinus]|nr:Trafficking protein particle complex subunit 33 [Chytriomyces hyalinus]